MEKLSTEEEFNDWLINNRHNKDISDEAYSEMIDFHLHYFRPDLHKLPANSGLSKSQIQEVKDLFYNENKLAAVKRFKELSGWGLKESKDWIENSFGSIASPHFAPPSTTTSTGKPMIERDKDYF